MEVIKSFATIDQGRSCRKPIKTINGNPREGNSLYLFKSRLLLPIQVIFFEMSHLESKEGQIVTKRKF